VSRADQRVCEERFRGVLEYALRFDVPQDGSLYLRILGAVYLAAPTEAEPGLGSEFYLQAATELADGDEVLTALLLAVPS